MESEFVNVAESEGQVASKRQRGGARRGAGRKKIADRECKVAFGISARAKANLERYAQENDVSLNEAAVRIFEGLFP
ncbi:MAG: hypothetical protein HDS26_03750 [Bacteroides sp.]|nr:hypothetical protein [Bacteroides sp.]MBD5306115.1 hypothetical protein [Bacteroides sp.]MBD5307221.1 hypothetical protein [Bacteroides sp.]MBD5307647.1 hypothetical protein [Bacteroides sp.]